jgi:hypothetical protein
VKDINLIKRTSILVLLPKKKQSIMKNKKTLVLGATAKPEKYAFKATLFVEKGHLFLRLVKS